MAGPVFDCVDGECATYTNYHDRVIGHAKPFMASEEMSYDSLRHSSYVGWPFWAVMSPADIANKGFFYAGHGDTVICYLCRGHVSGWVEHNQDVVVEHNKKFPRCTLGQKSVDATPNPKCNTQAATPELHTYNHDNLKPERKHIEASSSKSATQHAATGKGMPSNSALGETSASRSRPVTGKAATEDVGTCSKSGAASDVVEETRIARMSPIVSPPQLDAYSQKKNLPVEAANQRDNQPAATPTTDAGSMKLEHNRVRSFQGTWPAESSVAPVDLAKAGFYFCGRPDRVQCAFCSGRLRNWKETDVPMEEHQRCFSQCPLMLGNYTGNVPIERSVDSVIVPDKMRDNKTVTPTDRLGIMMDKPKHPDYAQLTARNTSFTMWPKKTIINHHILADAGFFYIGYSDNVKCFFCDGGLRNWEAEDDPWKEHAKWFSRCGFLRLTKGAAYIAEIQGTSPVGDLIGAIGGIPTVTGASLPEENTCVGEVRPRQQTSQTNPEQLSRSKSAATRRQRRNRNRKRKKDGVAGAGDTRLQATGDRTSNHSNSQEESPSGEESESEEEPRNVDDVSLSVAVREDEEIRHLSAEYKRIQDERLCKICMDEECMIVFLPCGHLVSCAKCAPALRNCPICRQLIKGSVRVYTT